MIYEVLCFGSLVGAILSFVFCAILETSFAPMLILGVLTLVFACLTDWDEEKKRNKA
jgi:hypothetical protein